METAPAMKPTADPPRQAQPATRAPRSRSHALPIWHQSPWKWCFSLGVGVFLLLVLTIASIIGSAIDPLERAQALIFYTWWYKALLLALALNMTCATIKTIMVKLLPAMNLRIHAQRGFYSGEQLAARIPFAGKFEDVAGAFRAHGFKVRTEDHAGVARSGWWGRFGAPVSHAGMVIVLLAGFASSWVAKEGVVQIPEGRTATSMQLRTGNQEVVPLGFALTVNDFDTGFFPRTRIPSHYVSDVVARQGEELLYAGPVEVNHSPKINGWRIHQTSYSELPTLPRYEVEVTGASLSEPLRTKISPGQTRALAGAGEGLELTMDQNMNWFITNASGQVASGTGGDAHDGSLPELTLLANRFEPDFVLGADRQITSRSEELNNPALHATLFANGAPVYSQWLFGRAEMKAMSHAPEGRYGMELLEVRSVEGNGGREFVVAVQEDDCCAGLFEGIVTVSMGDQILVREAVEPEPGAAEPVPSDWNVAVGDQITAYATVLTLTRNTAIPTIYFGCILMMFGLMMSFFVPRRDVWFMHDEERGELRVAARYRHPSDSFDRATSAALSDIPTKSNTPTGEKES